MAVDSRTTSVPPTVNNKPRLARFVRMESIDFTQAWASSRPEMLTVVNAVGIAPLN